MEIFESMQGFVADNLSLLADVETRPGSRPTSSPTSRAKDWSERLRAFRAAADNLPDELLVVLVGNMVTEEALPSYAIRLEHVALDETGCDDQPLGQVAPGLDRRGEPPRRPLERLPAADRPGRHAVGRADHPPPDPRRIQPPDPRRQALRPDLRRLPGAGDPDHPRQRRPAGHPARRREPGQDLPEDRRRRDPPRDLLHPDRRQDDRAGPVLGRPLAPDGPPGPDRDARQRMFDGQDPNLFDHFATVSQKVGTYTVRDYAAILRHLVDDLEDRLLSVSPAPPPRPRTTSAASPTATRTSPIMIAPALADEPMRSPSAGFTAGSPDAGRAWPIVEHIRSVRVAPSSRGGPNIRLKFCTATPAAPLIRLSRQARITTRPRTTRRVMSMKLVWAESFVPGGWSTTRTNGLSA